LGKVQVIDAVDTSKPGWEEAAAGLVRNGAADRSLSLSEESAELIALMTGGDRRQIDSELDKLDLYLGTERREVSEEDVRLLVPISHVGAVFELGNAIAARNVPRALELLDRLLFHGERAIGILLASIVPTVRSLLLARDLIARHRLSRPANPYGFGKQLERLPSDAVAHLPRKKDGGLNTYALGIAAIHAQRFSDSELREALHACLDANVKLVTSGLERRWCSPS
jgi:DNA polymerase-3 subunit delta